MQVGGVDCVKADTDYFQQTMYSVQTSVSFLIWQKYLLLIHFILNSYYFMHHQMIHVFHVILYVIYILTAFKFHASLQYIYIASSK